MTKKQSKKLYVIWVKKNFPKLYRAALVSNAGNGMGGGWDWLDNITESITSLAPKYIQYKQQKKVMKMQMDRAKQGLPPANVADYAPVIKTQIDLAPETRKELIDAGSTSLKEMVLPISLAVGAGVLFYSLKK